MSKGQGAGAKKSSQMSGYCRQESIEHRAGSAERRAVGAER